MCLFASLMAAMRLSNDDIGDIVSQAVKGKFLASLSRHLTNRLHFTLSRCDFQVPKCTKFKISRGSSPDPAGGASPLAVGECAGCPIPKNPSPRASVLWASHLPDPLVEI